MLCRVPGLTGRGGQCSSGTEQMLDVRVELSRAGRVSAVGEHLAVQLVEREAVPRRPPAQDGRRLRGRAAHQVQAGLQQGYAEFERMMQRWQQSQQRLSFKGGAF